MTIETLHESDLVATLDAARRPLAVEDRPLAYRALFMGEMPFEPQPDLKSIGLSGLYRLHTYKRGENGDRLNEHLGYVANRVAEILEDHDQQACSETENAEAIFSVLDKEHTLPTVIDITSQAVAIWEKALFRNKRRQLITYGPALDDAKGYEEDLPAHKLPLKSLVVETASSVLQILPYWSDKPTDPSQADKKNLAKVIANWGPGFVKGWMDGTIIELWAKKQNFDEAETQAFLEMLTPSIRRHFASHSVSSPLNALGRFVENIKQLTDEAIVEQTGWSAEEVEEIFTPAIRKHFALHNPSCPLSSLDKVAGNLRLLTDETIAEQTGWTIEEAREICTPVIRKYLATHNLYSPLRSLNKFAKNLKLLTDEAIAKRTGCTIKQAEEFFNPSLRKHFALHNPSDPLAGVEDYVLGKVTYKGEFFGAHKKTQ